MSKAGVGRGRWAVDMRTQRTLSGNRTGFADHRIEIADPDLPWEDLVKIDTREWRRYRCMSLETTLIKHT